MWARDLVQQLFAYDVDLLVHDSQVPWARVAGDYLGLPGSSPTRCSRSSALRSYRSEDDWELPTVHPEEAKERFEASWLAIARRWGVELGGPHAVIHSSHASETVLVYTTEEIVGDYELPGRLALHRPDDGTGAPTAPAGRSAAGVRVLRNVVQQAPGAVQDGDRGTGGRAGRRSRVDGGQHDLAGRPRAAARQRRRSRLRPGTRDSGTFGRARHPRRVQFDARMPARRSADGGDPAGVRPVPPGAAHRRARRGPLHGGGSCTRFALPCAGCSTTRARERARPSSPDTSPTTTGRAA